jgi:CHC2 zinc finger
MTEEVAKWIDFQSIKDAADVERVLDHCGILEHLERRGDELVGWCPLGDEHGKADSFAFNVAKKSFQCFACKARGSILDFMRKYKESDLRTAATAIQEIMGAEGKAPSPPRVPARKSRPYGKKAAGSAKRTTAENPRRALPDCLLWEEALALVEKGTIDPEELVVLHLTTPLSLKA